MDLSVIIVNHNTLPLTVGCVDSLYQHTRDLRFEVIVVDNASTDGSQEVLGDDERIIFLPLCRNEGFGTACNRALCIALGRQVLFLNPDTRLLNNAAEQMVALLDSRADVVACGANLYDEQLRPSLSFRPFLPSWLSEADALLGGIPQRLRYGRARYFNPTSHVLRVGYVTGAAMMVRRRALECVGGFDEHFFLYYEDTDLCRRLAEQGTLVSLPTARIQHLEGGSFALTRRTLRRVLYSEQGRDCYYSLNHSRRHHRVANALYRCSLHLRSLIFMVVGRWERSRESRLRLMALSHLRRNGGEHRERRATR